MLPISAESLNPPSNNVDLSIGPGAGATFMKENGACVDPHLSLVLEVFDPTVVKKLDTVSLSDRLSRAKGV